MADRDETLQEVSEDFLLHGIQEWGQPTDERARATARYCYAAGFHDIAGGIISAVVAVVMQGVYYETLRDN